MNKYIMLISEDFSVEGEITEVTNTYCFESELDLETLLEMAKEVAEINKKRNYWTVKEKFFGRSLNVAGKHDTCILEAILTLDDWFEQNKIKN